MVAMNFYYYFNLDGVTGIWEQWVVVSGVGVRKFDG
jgi:hypothetical protein